ncbi:MAG: hypothetical protein LBE21_10995 [Pseudomonadales bacterium]|jgi:hypothetical protein|nr:hypothetical protein [Pseudomonadales bacterium]
MKDISLGTGMLIFASLGILCFLVTLVFDVASWALGASIFLMQTALLSIALFFKGAGYRPNSEAVSGNSPWHWYITGAVFLPIMFANSVQDGVFAAIHGLRAWF